MRGAALKVGCTAWFRQLLIRHSFVLLANPELAGGVLQLGQMLSIQDDNIVPRQVSDPAAHCVLCTLQQPHPPQPTPCLSQIREIMERVRQHANVMPKWQLEKVMVGELGGAWREKFSMFDDEPMAAASIGQVAASPHQAAAMKWNHPQLARAYAHVTSNGACTLLLCC